MRRVRFFRLSYVVWALVPLTVFLVFGRLGAPHVIWSYSWRDQGQGMDPLAHRYYTRCTYYGARGELTRYPRNGRCAWLIFDKGTAR